MGSQRLDNAEQPRTQHILTLLEKTDAGDISVCDLKKLFHNLKVKSCVLIGGNF